MKLNLVKNQIDELKNNNLINAIFTTNSAYSDNDCTIDLYLFINKELFNVISGFVDKLFLSYDNLLFKKEEISNQCVKHAYYYENSININIYYITQLNIKLYQEIEIIYDPNNFLKKLPKLILPYTNLEYAKLLDEFSALLFDLYKCVLQDDRLLTYNHSLKIQEVYIKIYRGFYDSYNAKKEFKEINKTMDKSAYQNLINRIKLFRYDSFHDAIKNCIYDIDNIVSKLPINVISLFNIDFYNYSKKLIYNI